MAAPVTTAVAQVYRLHEPLAGRRRVQVEDRHDRLTFARVVACLLEEDYVQATRMTLVLDNLSAHQPAAFYEIFDPVRAHALLQRVEFVFTPKHGSWLNMAEIEFAALLTHGLPQRVPDRPTLEAHCYAWQLARTQLGAPTPPTGSLQPRRLASNSKCCTRQPTRFNLLDGSNELAE